MPLNIVLVPQPQSPKCIAVSWSVVEGAAGYDVFVAKRRLGFDELEAALASGGAADAQIVRVPAGSTQLVDDTTPEGERRFYGAAVAMADGSSRAARFKAGPLEGEMAANATLLSAAKPSPRRASGDATSMQAPVKLRGAEDEMQTSEHPPIDPSRPSPAATPVRTGSMRVSVPAAAPAAAVASAAPVDDEALAARKRAQDAARARAVSAAAMPAAAPAPEISPTASSAGYRIAPAPTAAPAAAEEDPMAARRRAQEAARARALASEASSATAAEPERRRAPEPVDDRPLEASAPSSVPAEPMQLEWIGATQTWDGLRVWWDRDRDAQCYDVVVADHRLTPNEVRDGLAGKDDFVAVVAAPRNVACVIDNVTPREGRAWYAVLARLNDGARRQLKAQCGDAASSGKPDAPFLQPNRTSEIRAEVEAMLEDARAQWARWTDEKDAGARREAQRLVKDALLVWPRHDGATALLREYR